MVGGKTVSMDGRLEKFHVALAHDWLVGLRGGEWVLDRLARQYGPTTLYTLVDDGRPLTEAISACRVVTSPLQQFPGAAAGWRRAYLPLMPWAIERLRVKPCDVLISTSSAVMKSIRPPAGTPHLCYCHSPARYIWEQGADYRGGAGGWLRSLGLKMVRRRFQHWDRRTANRVDRFLANSQHTAERIKRCYGREAFVVYPPVRTEWFTIDPSVQREDWFLLVAALEPYKRTEIAIDAANKAAVKLKVAGGGSQFEVLKKRCGPNVEMLGRVDEETLRTLYRQAKALIFPQVEDFGIVAVEAQATGCPVIAFEAGGAGETVTENSGVFFGAQTPEAIIEAMQQLEQKMQAGEVTEKACRQNAEKFSESIFDEAIHRHVRELIGDGAQESNHQSEGEVENPFSP